MHASARTNTQLDKIKGQLLQATEDLARKNEEVKRVQEEKAAARKETQMCQGQMVSSFVVAHCFGSDTLAQIHC